MKALILAGGLGTRLYPLTWGRPKVLVPLANRPFLERMLSWLASYGINDIILTLNYFPKMIAEHLGDGSRWNVHLHYLLEDTPLGSGGAIKNAAALLGDEPFFVLNGDILTDLNLTEMLAFHRDCGAAMTISLSEVKDPCAFGVVDMDENGRLRRFVEKPTPETAPSNLINAGVWLFEPEMLSKMPEMGRPFSVERDFWPASLASGIPMFGYRGKSYWMDIGTIRRYLRANLDFLAGTIKGDFDEIEAASDIWIGAKATVNPHAKLIAPVVIGARSMIEPGAEISDSIIGTGCRISAGAVIRNSVLWEEVFVGRDSKLINSVIGSHQQLADKLELKEKALEDFGATAPKEQTP